MRQSDAKDLEAFLEEFMAESDRGLALVGPAVVDEKLEEMLRAFFVDDPKIADLMVDSSSQRPISSLAVRADAALALGLIDHSEREEIRLLAKIRNKFAHQRHGTTFKSKEIADLCKQLKSELPPMGVGTPTSRARYTNAVIVIYLRLYYRPNIVAQERRTPRKWVSSDEVKWRTLESLTSSDPTISDENLFLVVRFKEKAAKESHATPFVIPAPKIP